MQQATVQPRPNVVRLRCRVFRLLLLLLLAAGGLSPSARADIQLPAKGRTRGEREQQKLAQRLSPPPAPLATSVRVEPGGRAEIVLQATGGLGRTIEFLLRTPPAHGEFEGVPRRLDRNRVAITYVHRAADGPGHDLFTFAAQTAGTPVSAAGTVDIEIFDPTPPTGPAAANAPDLAATPADLDFGAVEAGRSSGVTLTLENRGGGIASGQLAPPAPWSVEGDATYGLGHGSRQSFRVVFRPTGQGAFAETLRVEVRDGERTAGCVVRLVGTGLAATAPVATPGPVAVAAPAPLPVAAAPSLPTPAAASPMPVAQDTASPAPHALPGVADPGAFVVNEAAVAAVEVRETSATAVELAWRPPTPLPSSYRVERRHFVRDDREPDSVRTDWNLCERVDFRIRAGEVSATVRGLVPGEPLTLRVVSVDTAGRLAPPSPEVNALTAAGSTWWQPTLLKILLLALAVCAGLMVRQRWQEHQLLRELDARHSAPDEPPLFTAPK